MPKVTDVYRGTPFNVLLLDMVTGEATTSPANDFRLICAVARTGRYRAEEFSDPIDAREFETRAYWPHSHTERPYARSVTALGDDCTHYCIQAIDPAHRWQVEYRVLSDGEPFECAQDGVERYVFIVEGTLDFAVAPEIVNRHNERDVVRLSGDKAVAVTSVGISQLFRLRRVA